MSGLRFGALPATTLHLCIDMQRMFASGTPWASRAVEEARPGVLAVANAMPEATVFSRFITPWRPDHAHGAWRGYYEVYRGVTLEVMEPAMLDLVPELHPLVRPGMVIDKTAYSAFIPALEQILVARRPDTLVFTGVETEVCVLATLMAAIDRGYRCILVCDAVASGDPDAHRATIRTLQSRLAQQLELLTAAELVEAVRAAA